ATVALNPLRENEAGQIPYRSNYRLDFDVGPQSEKQYRLSVLCPEHPFGTEPVQINITANGRVGVQRFVQLRDLEGKDFIVVVSESSGSFRHLGTRQKKVIEEDIDVDPADSQKQRMREVAVVEPAELPTRWHDLALANLIILDGPPREKLSDAQWDALKAYVQAGGHILITAGKDPSRLKGPIEELAGISARDMVTVQSLDTFFDSYDPGRPEWNLPLVDVKVNADAKSASVPQYNKKTGFVEQCRRYYGAGSVTFLPFSLSDRMLENWAGRTNVPLQILEAARGRRIFGVDRPEPETKVQYNMWGMQAGSELDLKQNSLAGLRFALDESFTRDTPVELQKPPMVMSFILLYLLCAVPVNYFIFGWFKRREVAWLAAPVWAVTFSVLAYVVGYMGKTGKLTVNEVSVVEAGPGQGIGIARTFVGFYAPRRDEYRVRFPGVKGFDVQAAPSHLINLSFAQARNVDLPRMDLVDNDAGLQVENLLVQQRATRRLEVMHRVSLKDGLEVTARENPAMINVFDSIEVANNTGYDLFSPVFVSQGKAVPLSEGGVMRNGDVCKLQNVGTTVPWNDAGAAFFGKTMIFRGVRGPHAARRIEALSLYIKDRVDSFQGGVVCAYIEGPMLPIEVAAAHSDMERPGTFEGITMLLAPVPVKRFGDRTPDGARRFKIRSSSDFDPYNKTGSWSELNDRAATLAINQAGNAGTLEIEVPTDFRNLVNNRMQLVLNGRLGVAANKQIRGRVFPQNVASMTGEVKFEILRTLDSKQVRWDELTNVIFAGLGTGQPFKLPQIELPLEDYHFRADNVIRLRVTVRYNGEKHVLELQRLECKAVQKPQ
ncbi:MAG TPA: hypothetical protein VEJ63_11300, partial [Planctomycetota bacterium]|nr:hypothetical protein [Planctomycetota bacterium]